MAVQCHSQPLCNFGPSDRAQLVLTVGRNDRSRPNPRSDHPDGQPRNQSRLANTATRRDGRPQDFEHLPRRNIPVFLDVVSNRLQHLTLPLTRTSKVLKRRVLSPPRKHILHKRQRVVFQHRTPQHRHQLLFIFRFVDRCLHVSPSACPSGKSPIY